MKRAVLRTRADGATALFDSVYRVAGDLERIDGKKALLVFTDGDDNASILNARSAIRQAREIGVPVFAAAQGSALQDKYLIDQIRDLAKSTGGLAFEMKKSSQARKIFDAISDSLRHGYLLAYRAPEASTRQWRRIEVTVSGVRRPRVRTKSGYMAMPQKVPRKPVTDRGCGQLTDHKLMEPRDLGAEAVPTCSIRWVGFAANSQLTMPCRVPSPRS